FNTTAGNPVKKILLKLNLSDHRLFKDGGGDFRYSDNERLSQSDEVLKLTNLKKDVALKFFKSTIQERYEHVGSEITNPQDGKEIHWIRGDDEVELTDEESSDDEDEVVEVFRIDTNVFGFKTYVEYKDDYIYDWNKDVPWVHEKPWTKEGAWKEPTPVKHYCKPFNYKTGCSEWPTCSWRNDGYCNGGNIPGAYIVGNSLHYQDYEWYEALEDSKLKEEALRNKAIMEGLVN
ncbi:hypothetical protein Tco_1168999, partial [Tanacetum coccineum]